jgi:hypothetical protein
MVHGVEIIQWSSLLLCQSQTTHVVSDINHASMQPQRFVHSSLPSFSLSGFCFLNKVLSGPNKGSLDLLWNMVFASALHNYSDSHTYDASVRKYLPHFYNCSPSAFIWIILVSVQSKQHTYSCGCPRNVHWSTCSSAKCPGLHLFAAECFTVEKIV